MTTYTVQAGDNLTRIAKAHNTTVEELARKNNIQDVNKILIGQKLSFGETTEVKQTKTPQMPAYEEPMVGMDSFQKEEQKTTSGFADSYWGTVAGGATLYGAYKAAPYVKKGVVKGFEAVKNGSKALANGAKNAAVAGKHGAEVAGNATKSGFGKLFNGIKNKFNHIAKKAELEYVFGKDAVKHGTQKVGNGIKHAAKKVELEYAFGKETVKNGLTKAGKTVKETAKHAAKGAELEYAFKNDAAKQIMKVGKAGKVLGKLATPVAAFISGAEIYSEYKENGIESAAKQTAKTGSGLACSWAGAKIGGLIGACTGPAAPIAVPVLSTVGAIAGWIGGEKLANKALEMFS